MEALSLLARWELGAFMSVLTALVGYQILTGRISTAGLPASGPRRGLT